MKGLNLIRSLRLFGTALVLLLTTNLATRAQTGPYGPPISPLSIEIMAPTNGANFVPDTNIVIDATVKSYSEYPRWVAFYAGSNQLFLGLLDPIGPIETNGYPLKIEFTWTNVPAGAYTLTGVVTNVLGRSATSAPVNINVGPVPPPIPVVRIVATDPIASMVTGDTGTFTVYRTGDTNDSLDVFYSISGTALNGVDYQTLGTSVSIPAGAFSADITVIPIKDPLPDPSESVRLTLTPSPLANPLPSYQIGIPSNAVVTILGINSRPQAVSIIATDPIAVEPGSSNRIYFTPLFPTPFTNYFSPTNTATFLVRRISPTVVGSLTNTNSDLTVYYNIGGTASNGVDYVTLPGFVTIPAGKNFALITVNPLEDIDASNAPAFSTVVLSLYVPPTVTSVPPPVLARLAVQGRGHYSGRKHLSVWPADRPSG